MSTKSLKRLQKERGIDDTLSYTDGSETSLNSDIRMTNIKSKNYFNLLDNDNENDSINEDNEKISKNEPDFKKQAKKNKKKKKFKKIESNEKDLDDLIKEFQDFPLMHLPMVDKGHCPKQQCFLKPVLNIEHKHLDPSNEIKRIFGTHVIQKDKKKQRNSMNKRFKLVHQRNDWINFKNPGLSMKFVESKDGKSYFLFEHNKQYQVIQTEFYEAIKSIDPSNLLNLLAKNPFHITLLYQASEVYRLTEEWQVATELIERALFVIENSFHTLFSLTQGNCRLDYKLAENRIFFLVIFRHLSFLGKKGCYRTALEFCKLLLSLEPDNDPLGVLLMIDFYALRSNEYSYLVDLYNQWEDARNLFQLPNLAFSTSLALYHLSQKKVIKFNNENCSEILQENGKTTFNKENYLKRANFMLQKSLLMYPTLLLQLLEKCNVVPDKDVLSHQHFILNKSNEPNFLRGLIQLYLERTSDCWKDKIVLDWLELNVREIINSYDSKLKEIKQFTECRLIRYKGLPRNVQRHVILSDIKDIGAFMLENRNSIMNYDPLPPLNSISAYTVSASSESNQQSTFNPFSAFIQSIFPGYVLPHQGNLNSSEDLRNNRHELPNVHLLNPIHNNLDQVNRNENDVNNINNREDTIQNNNNIANQNIQESASNNSTSFSLQSLLRQMVHTIRYIGNHDSENIDDVFIEDTSIVDNLNLSDNTNSNNVDELNNSVYVLNNNNSYNYNLDDNLYSDNNRNINIVNEDLERPNSEERERLNPREYFYEDDDFFD